MTIPSENNSTSTDWDEGYESGKCDTIQNIIIEVEKDIKKIESMSLASQECEGKIIIKKNRGFIKMLRKKLGSEQE